MPDSMGTNQSFPIYDDPTEYTWWSKPGDFSSGVISYTVSNNTRAFNIPAHAEWDISNFLGTPETLTPEEFQKAMRAMSEEAE